MLKKNFNLRGIPPRVMEMLKNKAREQQLSVNVLIISLIEKGVGYSHKIKNPTYHELDSLAGTWSKKEVEEFNEHTHSFEQVDEELWK